LKSIHMTLRYSPLLLTNVMLTLVSDVFDLVREQDAASAWEAAIKTAPTTAIDVKNRRTILSRA